VLVWIFVVSKAIELKAGDWSSIPREDNTFFPLHFFPAAISIEHHMGTPGSIWDGSTFEPPV
jgi:hypothetical protein